jgi:aspartate carbamoyltransferase catalytic subunit
MLPTAAECLGARVTTRLEEAIEGADVAIALRIQLERGAGAAFPSNREYAVTYGLTRKRLRGAKRDLLLMHPGPINRGVEMSPDVADGPFSVILEQVEYGVACRMAILYLLAGRKADEPAPSPPSLEEGAQPAGAAPVRRTEDAFAR